VEGYINSGKSALKVQGSRSIIIILKIISSFDVYATPEFSARRTGSLFYSIALPLTVNRGFLVLSPINAQRTRDYPATSREIDISTGAGGIASGTLDDLPEESYLALIDLYGETNNKAVVHIRDGLSAP
jgi:hypothetical protein